MLLTLSSLPFYLLERGLLTPECIVDGELIVMDSSSRHNDFKVVRTGQPGYFVKQVRQWDPQTIAFLEREANTSWLAANDPGFAALAPFVPKYHLMDQARHILVTELLPEGENLSEYHRRLGLFPLAVAARLGDLIGAYQRNVQPGPANAARTTVFPRSAPWILSAHEFINSPNRGLGGADQQVVSIIGRYADFHKYLDAIDREWRFDCFMHGDMKWENCIVYAQDGSVEVKIVDWETADFGDACWDVGAILQAYLTFWIMSIPMQGQMSPAEFLELAPFPIEAMQPAIRAFWLAYAQARGLGEVERDAVLRRSVGCGAARMLQTAFEYMYFSPQITTNALAMLQVSLNILADPRAAAADFLNL